MIQTALGRYPLHIQPLFFLTLLLLGSGVGSVGGALTFAVAATLAILVHELGHALVYEHFGHRVQIELVALGGLTRSLEGPDLTPGRHLLVSLAGPAMGFSCAAAIAASLALGLNDVLPAMLIDVANWVAGLSVVWGVFNLLPVHPGRSHDKSRFNRFRQLMLPRHAEDREGNAGTSRPSQLGGACS